MLFNLGVNIGKTAIDQFVLELTLACIVLFPHCIRFEFILDII